MSMGGCFGSSPENLQSRACLHGEANPWRPPEKYAFGKRLRASFFALNLLEPDAGSVGLPVAVYLAPDPPGWFPFIPLEPLSRRLSRHVIPLCAQGQAATRWASLSLDRAGCRGFVRLRRKVARGMKGSGFVQLRCMEVYRGYSRYWSDSIWGSINGCLWRLWIDLPINCWVEVCTFFSCDCAADSVQWSFEVILSDIRSLNESYRLSQTDPGFDHPENPEWGELALSWYASVSERVGKSSEPILEWERRPL